MGSPSINDIRTFWSVEFYFKWIREEKWIEIRTNLTIKHHRPRSERKYLVEKDFLAFFQVILFTGFLESTIGGNMTEYTE
jgi:hypothetical protein